MVFYKIENGKAQIGNKPHGDDWIEYTVGSEPAELKVLLDAEEEAKIIPHFKGLYLDVVNTKLAELDYDSLATVKLWEGDVQFGAEASKILAWYKSIIAYNYALITAGDTPTDEEYLAGVPVYV